NGPRNRIGGGLNGLLAQKLAVGLLESHPNLDLYAYNGFRLLGVPGNVKDEQLPKLSNGYQKVRFPGDHPLPQTIGAGFSRLGTADEADRCIRDLLEPQKRIVSELFWPHLPDAVFDVIRKVGDITPPIVLRFLRDYGQANGSGSGILAKHAVAVAYH